MTDTDFILALDLVSINEGNSRLTDLIFQNVSSIFLSLENPAPDHVSNIARMYIWAWLMIGYELGKKSKKTYAYQLPEDEILSVYKTVFKKLDRYDEDLLEPIRDRLDKIDFLYSNNGFTSLLRNMISIMSAWMCEVGMVIARKPHILQLELHYIPTG